MANAIDIACSRTSFAGFLTIVIRVRPRSPAEYTLYT